MCFVQVLRSQCNYYTDELQSLDKAVQVKDTQLSQLQGEHMHTSKCTPNSTLKAKQLKELTWSHTGQLQTLNKVLQAKDTELQAVQKLMKGSEGEVLQHAWCLHRYLYMYM